jgi:hypothetical protein
VTKMVTNSEVSIDQVIAPHAIANGSVRDRACLHSAGVSPAVLSGAG